MYSENQLRYNVMFYCSKSDYHYIVAKTISSELANRVVEDLNTVREDQYRGVHDDYCCFYYYVKDEEESYHNYYQ